MTDAEAADRIKAATRFLTRTEVEDLLAARRLAKRDRFRSALCAGAALAEARIAGLGRANICEQLAALDQLHRALRGMPAQGQYHGKLWEVGGGDLDDNQ
jgi:hypothetical protein